MNARLRRLRSAPGQAAAGFSDVARPRLIYVSYDGATDPLGESQILAYLERAAHQFDITLVSFEKPTADRTETERRLKHAGIRWVPLGYHKHPPILSTGWDVIRGIVVVQAEAWRRRPEIVHARSVVAATMAAMGPAHGRALVFDMRAFWADERLEAEHGVLIDGVYRGARAVERWIVRRADAIVTLTERSVPQIHEWAGGSQAVITVIPTCTDVGRFADNASRPEGPHAVWVGSLGPRYRFDLAVDLARALEMPMTVLTRQVPLARSLLAGRDADVRAVASGMVWRELYEADVGLCLYTDEFSRQATAPTRAAEHLAAGMPIAVTPGIGDLEKLVENEGVGVVVRGESEVELAEAARRLRDLVSDPHARARCRRVAAERFSLEAGVAAYSGLWAQLARVPRR